MASNKKVAEFPHAENKLQAPTKKSLFERQKAEQEAKRLREEAETKAVYEDFVKSFDDEDEPSASASGGYGLDDAPRFGGLSGGAPKRHFAPSGTAGRGFGERDLGKGGRPPSGVGSLGPPPSLAKNKRSYEGFQQGSGRGTLAFDDHEYEERAPKRAFNMDDDYEGGRDTEREEDRAVPKPTLRLASLPPGTSPAVIKALLPANLKVEAVRILPASGPLGSTERKSISAIVTLAKDMGANDIDTAVNGLQNRYLGYGYYLNLHRHLSSAAISSTPSAPALGSAVTSQPFGAKVVDVAAAGRGHAPPPHQRGFAPPTSYAPAGPNQLPRSGPLLHVPVQAPRDIKELKLIHKVIENLLTHGPEFEALLMSRPSVQREEKWAWIWDPRSVGGIWYRWRLWEVLTGSTTKRGQGKYLPLFEGSSAWKSPDKPLAYEFTTQLSEFISDSEYHSSDEDDSGEEGAARRQHHGGGAASDPSSLVDDGKAYLNPLEKAKFTHLLARLPTSTGKLRKGDVARVTAFAISHAGRGADEIVYMVLSNISKPFAYTSANPSRASLPVEDSKGRSSIDSPVPGPGPEDDSDTSAASLIGLYLISDILSSSSTSGVRHAWRYRSLFEVALKSQHTFEFLGRMERKMNWGKLKAEKWKRSVGMVLGLWEGWCVFPVESQEGFARVFNNPPATAQEEKAAKRKEEEEQGERSKKRWKAVEVAAASTSASASPQPDSKGDDEEDVDGEPMDEDDDVDGEPMVEDDDVDGEPMVEDEDGKPMEEESPVPLPTSPRATLPDPPAEHEKPGPLKRARPRAVDMFADSDDEA
ncbi:hypothetical protein B2J93_4516 [Marssonina coronariae]|uniref:CID domain-containing protein n=1 Tax=Diplocarpon coronariae TaxID=2795749 RepID=A0A218Z864_9HELO|nr:hypothetical protein JHW43_002879 [Diplocarpon mali]OWP03952.1 hypothetical protein B2J93_4516 [Marssonina coronariae]